MKHRDENPMSLFSADEADAIAQSNAKDREKASRATAAGLTKEILHGRSTLRSITGPLFTDQHGLFDTGGEEA